MIDLSKFFKEAEDFTNNKCNFNVIRNIRKILSLFPIKDHVKPYSCIVIKFLSSRQFYIGETFWNPQIRAAEDDVGKVWTCQSFERNLFG